MANKKRVRKRYNLRSKTRALNDTPEQSSNSDVEMRPAKSPPVRFQFKPRQWPIPPPSPTSRAKKKINQPGPSGLQQPPPVSDNESTDTASEVTENIANETNNKNAGAVGEKEKKKMPKSIEVPGPPNINSSSIEDSENEGLSDDPPPVNERHGISNSDGDDSEELRTDAEDSSEDDRRSEEGEAGDNENIRPPRAASATITPQIREITPNVCETRDRLSMQSDNILIFVNVQGKSYDEGSRELADVLQIPNNLNNAYCRSVVIPYKGDKRCIVAVPKYRKMDLVSTGDILNSTNHRVAILAGSQNMGGDCKSGTYSDEYGTWSGVVVDATFEITLTEYETALNSKTNEVLLRSGTRCEAGKLNCITSDGMSAFWSEVPKN
ncbi:Protein of unknown function, partial [Cotesia congregata]